MEVAIGGMLINVFFNHQKPLYFKKVFIHQSFNLYIYWYINHNLP